MPATRRWFPIVPAKPKTLSSRTWPSPPPRARSRPDPRAARIALPSTTSCSALKRNSGRPRRMRAAAHSGNKGRLMYKLVLVRHGESDWNRENRFTGWTDVDLSEKGRQEAKEGGEVLRREGYTFDVAYT